MRVTRKGEASRARYTRLSNIRYFYLTFPASESMSQRYNSNATDLYAQVRRTLAAPDSKGGSFYASLTPKIHGFLRRNIAPGIRLIFTTRIHPFLPLFYIVPRSTLHHISILFLRFCSFLLNSDIYSGG